jgi:arabinofuranan 3-O-arabinosyltransferase
MVQSTESELAPVEAKKPFLRFDTVLFGLLAYVPLLISKRGLLADDTKVYLYFDPRHLMSTAASLWNSDVAFGTVTHQNIGYLFPMGPYYWLAHEAQVPVWIAQRLWMGTLLWLAALGVRRCAQELGLSRNAGWVAALPYMLSPFILVNIDRTSAILMPWAGLGWMLLFTIRAARNNSWRYPALFALVVALSGGVNATSIVMVAFAPLFYLIFAAWTGDISWRRVAAVMARIGVLSLLVSVWWLAGLWAEGKYGINILRFTESFATVTTTSSSSEVFRGLGYWYFYGLDGLQPWTLASVAYMSGQIVPAASFVAPVVGVIGALCIRWKYRVFAVVVAFVGVVIAVGSYPLNKPTPFGVVLRWLANHTTVGLAMRSSNRVIPIMLLALALLSGATFDALRHKRPRVAWIGAGLFGVAVLAGMLPLFQGRAISSNLTLPERLPSYVKQAAHELNQGSSTSGVLGLPGLDFAYYRYGTFNDSIWPAIVHRPWISSQVQLEGLPASINLIRGLDTPLQDGIAEPTSLAPIARLFGASNLLMQMNTQYERYGTPTPWYLDQLMTPAPTGLSLVANYGPTTDFQAINGPYVNESLFSLPREYTFPKSLSIYHVDNARSLVRTESATSPQIVAGDGEGLVTMGALGLLDNQSPLLYDASSTKSQIVAAANQPGAWLVLTDSNQKRLDTYGTLHSTLGYVQQLHETPLVANGSEQSLPVFPHEVARSQTVAIMKGLAQVNASGYGNVIANNAEDQPAGAVDGNLNTSWEVSAFDNAIGQYWQETALAPHWITSIHIVQVQSPTQNRSITKIGISINGRTPIVRVLPHISVSPAGYTVNIPRTYGRTVRLIVLDDSDHDRNLSLASGVGFAEVQIDGFGPASRGMLLPTTLLSRAGAAARTDHLSIVTNRVRVSTFPPRLDPELSLLRFFDLPYARHFSIRGYANINPAISDNQLNALIGRHPSSGVSVVNAKSGSRLSGNLNSSAWNAFDNNPRTLWLSNFHSGKNEYMDVKLNAPLTISTFSISIVNDGYHTIPRVMTLSNGVSRRQFTLPITVHAQTGVLNTTEKFSVTVPAITGTHFRFTVDQIDVVTVIDRVNGGINFPSMAVSDVSLLGLNPGITPTVLDSGCRRDLLKIDGQPVSIRIIGTMSDALAQRRLPFTVCSSASIGTTLGVGEHVISSTGGYLSGYNINNVVLDSPGINIGPAATSTPRGAVWFGRSVVRSQVTAADAGRWVVLGQSFGAGWHATINGHDLGTPTLIDGAAMGWKLPTRISGISAVAFVWAPQQVIFYALMISLAGILLVLLMALTNRPRRRAVAVTSDLATNEMSPEWAPFTMSAPSRAPALYIVAVVVALCVSLYAVPLMLLAVALWQRRRSFGAAFGFISALLVVAGALITIVASRLHFTTDISWPTHIDFANGFIWSGLALWVVVVLGSSAPRARHRLSTPPENSVPVAPRSRRTKSPHRRQRWSLRRRNSRVANGTASFGATALSSTPPFAPPLQTPAELVPLSPEPESPIDVTPVNDPLFSAVPTLVVAEPTVPFVLAQPTPPLTPTPTPTPEQTSRRRRGLNVPDTPDAPVASTPEEIEAFPTTGLRRTMFLMRGSLRSRKDPDKWNSILTQDALNQVIGKTPIFNRVVLDISDTSAQYTEGLQDRGAHVTSLRLAQLADHQPMGADPDEPSFTPTHIPAATAQFDLSVATNIFSSVADPAQLLDELIRVTRPGGTIYIQNVMWRSAVGGRETSPWHLVSGSYARSRYRKRHGHEPDNRFGENLFKLRPGAFMQLLHSRKDLIIFIAGPRYLPTKWSWTLRVPLLSTLVVQDLVVAAERR